MSCVTLLPAQAGKPDRKAVARKGNKGRGPGGGTKS